jgi:hypothetical protein
VGLLLQSCRTVLFNAPQPISGERLTEFPIEQQGTFEAYSATKDTSTYFYFFSSYITEDYPKKEEINPSSKITILIEASNLKVSITDLKTNKTWSKTFGLSDTVILKKDRDLYVLNFLWRRTIENISDQGEVVNTIQKNDWFPLIFEKYKNGWTVNFINGPWDTNSKKQFEEINEENGFLILNDLTHDDLEKINKIKTNRLFQTTASAINFSSINVSKYDAKRFEQKQKDQENAFKSETRYCRKAYNWLYKREVGRQPMAYIVQVGYSPKFEVRRDEKSPTGNRRTLAEPFDISFNLDSLENYEDYSPVIPSPLFDETYLVLEAIYKEIDVFEPIDLCKLQNIIPAQIANEIIQSNLIYMNLNNENTNINSVEFNLDSFKQKIEPYLKNKDALLNTPMAEDCGCGMGFFSRNELKDLKKNYKAQKKTKRN